MTLRAVVFDLGGVLELDVIELVDHGLDTRWEARLGLQAGELEHRMKPFWRAGSVGACTEEQRHHQVEDMCDLIIYSHEVGVAKPDRRIFELTWQRLGLQPEEMLFLDNAQVHVEAARASGIQAILFEDTAQALAALESRLQAPPR
jgi:beta-phosphoglucomutase-like phosphatase (HAD superfamily)